MTAILWYLRCFDTITLLILLEYINKGFLYISVIIVTGLTVRGILRDFYFKIEPLFSRPNFFILQIEGWLFWNPFIGSWGL